MEGGGKLEDIPADLGDCVVEDIDVINAIRGRLLWISLLVDVGSHVLNP